jgi:methylenetetrahydrofolate reductase (NADPH)
MTFAEKLHSGKFMITAEVGPPKGIETDRLIGQSKLLGSRVDAINITDQQSAVMKLGSLAICSLLKRQGIDCIMQITCRDRNRLALQSDVLSAASLGIENLLILTGDFPTLGDHPDAKPVYDLDSVQLLKVVRGLEQGLDMRGNKLEGRSPKFCLGAVVNPGAEPIEPQIFKMEKKIEAGAEFFQTQGIYDLKIFEDFLSKTKHLKTKILAGIILLKSDSMARYINKNLAGISVPDDLIQEIKSAQDKAEKSVEIASRLIRQLKSMCEGVHIMPLGWEELIPKILDKSGI